MYFIKQEYVGLEFGSTHLLIDLIQALLALVGITRI